MFEHMRNHKILLHKISNFLKDGGKLFVHIFTHHTMVYPYEDNGPGDWMAREFLWRYYAITQPITNFQDDLKIESQAEIRVPITPKHRMPG